MAKINDFFCLNFLLMKADFQVFISLFMASVWLRKPGVYITINYAIDKYTYVFVSCYVGTTLVI